MADGDFCSCNVAFSRKSYWASDRVAEKVHAAVKDVTCEGQVVSVVQDEAANAVSAGRLLMEKYGWDPLTCGAHRLQTCIRHSLDANRHLQTLLARCRRLVAHFNQSALEMERLAAHQHNNPPLKVRQDCTTRWNSSFYMLEQLLRLKVLLITVLEDESTKEKD